MSKTFDNGAKVYYLQNGISVGGGGGGLLVLVHFLGGDGRFKTIYEKVTVNLTRPSKYKSPILIQNGMSYVNKEQ